MATNGEDGAEVVMICLPAAPDQVGLEFRGSFNSLPIHYFQVVFCGPFSGRT